MKLSIRTINDRLTVGTKIGALLAVMLLVAAINVGVVYYYQTQNETITHSVNVAGQQRTLTQRMAWVSFMISLGHPDQPLLVSSIDQFDSNLDILENGGETANGTVRPAPPSVSDSIERERTTWETYREHARNVVELEPYDPEFQRSLNYILDHEDELLQSSNDVVDAYADYEGQTQYNDEVAMAGTLGLRSQRIVKTALQIQQLTNKPGSEAITRVTVQESGRMHELRSNLRLDISAYGGTLDALENGGTYRGARLKPAPSEVAAKITVAQDVWSDFEPHATTVLERDPVNAQFWTSLSYVETHTDELEQISQHVTEDFATYSNARSQEMKEILVGLFVFDFLVFALGSIVGRRYIGKPITEIAAVAQSISRGQLADADVSTISRQAGETGAVQKDELVTLIRSFDALSTYLNTVADQAEALADQEFDAPVLDEEVPGEFGVVLSRMQADLERLITDIEQARLDSEAAQDEAEALTAALEEKAAEFSEVMAAAADGDLTRRVDTESRSEAMSDIGLAFNEMVAELEATLLDVREFAQTVAGASTDVTVGSEEVENASMEVTDSIQEISAGAAEQNENLQSVSGEMTDLSATIEEIAASSDEVADVSREAAERGERGRAHATSAIDEMDGLQTRTDETVAEVEALNDEVGQIGDVVDLIDSIAEQTNMLALNASIEAARAGEAGEGFAVVATEIKSLAEETKEATDDIETLIEGVQDSTGATVEEMQTMGDRVTESVETVEDALAALEAIVARVEEVNSGVQSISATTDEQAASSEEVVTMVDEVASISEETTAQSQQVAAAAEEQTASITEVSSSAQRLADQATELSEMLAAFDIGAGQPADSAGGPADPFGAPSGDADADLATGDD